MNDEKCPNCDRMKPYKGPCHDHIRCLERSLAAARTALAEKEGENASLVKDNGELREEMAGQIMDAIRTLGENAEVLAECKGHLAALRTERDKLKAYTATLEAECMAVTECAYALELTLNWAGNYGYDAKVVRHQEAKAEIMYCDLFAIKHGREPTVGVKLLREKNDAAASRQAAAGKEVLHDFGVGDVPLRADAAAKAGGGEG